MSELEKDGKTPREEEIRQRAYEIYAGRGFQDGNQEADWIQAEAELIEENRQRNPRQSASNSTDSSELNTRPAPRKADRASHSRESLSH